MSRLDIRMSRLDKRMSRLDIRMSVPTMLVLSKDVAINVTNKLQILLLCDKFLWDKHYQVEIKFLCYNIGI